MEKSKLNEFSGSLIYIYIISNRGGWSEYRKGGSWRACACVSRSSSTVVCIRACVIWACCSPSLSPSPYPMSLPARRGRNRAPATSCLYSLVLFVPFGLPLPRVSLSLSLSVPVHPFTMNRAQRRSGVTEMLVPRNSSTCSKGMLLKSALFSTIKNRKRLVLVLRPLTNLV